MLGLALELMLGIGLGSTLFKYTDAYHRVKVSVRVRVRV